jgi:DNA (cytosine-5)-methyltransferase 1
MGLTHFSLFTGIGGIDLAAEWAGFETVGQCEWADYPTKVLEKHWPDVPRWRDIRSVTAESFYERTGLRTVDLISGGFPCQPFSTAGNRKGKEDDRYLWPEMLRVIQEFKPSWVLGENVAGIIDMALDQVLSDLEAQSYSTEAFVIPACSINAPHRRERVFIVAYSNSGRLIHRQFKEQPMDPRNQTQLRLIESNINVAYTNSTMPSEPGRTWAGRAELSNRSLQEGHRYNPNNWESEPNVGRVANGIPSRVDRLKCLGNAVVPQQAYPILQAIADIENSL